MRDDVVDTIVQLLEVIPLENVSEANDQQVWINTGSPVMLGITPTFLTHFLSPIWELHRWTLPGERLSASDQRRLGLACEDLIARRDAFLAEKKKQERTGRYRNARALLERTRQDQRPPPTSP